MAVENTNRSLFMVWLGQLMSAIGAGLTAFVISVWAFESTGQALISSSILVVRFLPMILLSPLIGIFIDGKDKKKVLLGTEVLLSVNCLFLFSMFNLEWISMPIIFLIMAIDGCLESVRMLVYDSSVALLFRKQNFGRVNGLISLLNSAPIIIAPMLAVFLMQLIGITGVIFVDFISFFIAIFTLTFVKVEYQESKSTCVTSIYQDLSKGFEWIFRNDRIFSMQFVFTGLNFFNGIGVGLITPFILTRTAGNEESLAQLYTAGAAGAVIGGIIVSGLKAEPKNKVPAILLGVFLAAFIGRLGIVQAVTITGWCTAMFARQLVFPVVNSWNQSIWQDEVPISIQGRVFGARRFLGQGVYPLGLILGGYFADRVFEPFFESYGAGMGFMVLIAIAGVGEMLSSFIGYLLFKKSSQNKLMMENC